MGADPWELAGLALVNNVGTDQDVIPDPDSETAAVAPNEMAAPRAADVPAPQPAPVVEAVSVGGQSSAQAIEPTDVLAEVGAGSGAFARRLAVQTGDEFTEGPMTAAEVAPVVTHPSAGAQQLEQEPAAEEVGGRPGLTPELIAQFLAALVAQQTQPVPPAIDPAAPVSQNPAPASPVEAPVAPLAAQAPADLAPVAPLAAQAPADLAPVAPLAAQAPADLDQLVADDVETVFPPVLDTHETRAHIKAAKPKKSRRSRRSRKSEQIAEPTADSVNEGPQQTASWTGGNALLAKAFTGLICLGLVTGPVALGVQLLGGAVEQPAPVTQATEVRWDAATLAGDRARELVVAWLTASRTSDARLTALYSGPLTGLPNTGQEAKDVTVAQITPAGEGLWSVLVGADVKVPEPTEEDPQAASWVRQHFQVPVAVAGTTEGLGAQVLGLPAPMPGPVIAEGLGTNYRDRLSTTSQVGESLTGFFAALLTGQGNLSRYMTPGADLTPIAPAPYTGARLRSISAIRTDIDVDDPKQGDELDLLVDLELVRGDGEKTFTSYALDLTARDGRWEVSAVSATPTVTGASAAQDKSLPAEQPGQIATPNTAGASNGGTK